jgi:hypothetical protein
MKQFILILSVGFLALATPLWAQEPIPAEKEADIRTLVTMTVNQEEVINAMKMAMEPMAPQLPEGFMELFFKKVNPKELIDLSVPIYHKHFSHEEIKGMIEFYKTPLGKVLAEKQPKVLEESIAAGQQWGQKLAMEVMQELTSQPSSGDGN